MRRLILKMSLSLDGFVSGPNNETNWITRNQDEAATAWLTETLWQAGLHAMGRRTYQDMAQHWPTSPSPLAAPMNAIPKVLFTRQQTPSPTPWPETQIANGDLATEITRLKQQPGNPILAHGGATFAQSLVASGQIDEYRLLIHPIALGAGLPLFPTLPSPTQLHLVSTTPFKSGVTAQIYRPA